ncbi:unnamed protein product [Pieris macdunnoughi]|uniref:Valine--tRNA ligase n=1 Tax=Pieris macdunnoughi TaxID=345717 RepID=A0A821WZS2_9NEOP|nr:unnamed protein product [Pieris macdunnoughi]
MSENNIQNGLPDDQPQEKTAKQLEKEAKKAAKLEKLKAKLDKKSVAPAVPKDKPEKKAKETKESAVYTANTAAGERKDISGPMPDAYSPKYVEAAWYAWWDKQGFFKPEYGKKSVLDSNPKGQFVMVIPPPNVTGSLHLGHALTNAVEDAITRWHRMNGRTTLWNPGCDHAGIATQVVVEKKLWREEKKTRHELGREEFIKRVWNWKEEKGGRIYEQLRSLGSSLDWSRERFTMDSTMCRAVNEAFIRLHDAGDIYRANRLVNWSCTLKSAISDIEVDKVELTGRTLLAIPGYENKVEFGVIVYFAYKMEDSDDEVVVATTRVETMLGDVAVAVNPNDDRYKKFIGKRLVHPIVNRKLPVIADDYVDMTFGTGAVKITPAHDQNDYEIGKRHNLPFINIFDDEGRMLDNCGPFAYHQICRKTDRSRIHRDAMATSRRSVQRYYVTIWGGGPFVKRGDAGRRSPITNVYGYIRCNNMAAEAIKAVKTGELKIIPDAHEKTWYHWMENIRDWCISRQLWWGHQIPAYKVRLPEMNSTEDEVESVFACVSERNACKGPREVEENGKDHEEKDTVRSTCTKGNGDSGVSERKREIRDHGQKGKEINSSVFKHLLPVLIFGALNGTEELVIKSLSLQGTEERVYVKPHRRRTRSGRKKAPKRSRLVRTQINNEELWVSAHSEDDARRKAATKFNVAPEDVTLKRDDDVLDTWFSSGLFPFAIFGWPDETDDLKAFYPTTLLETGHDILFFWVARMVFFGQRLMGKLPFKEVYLHPMVRDAHGRKMSKSLGNVIDPVDVVTGITLEELHAQLAESNLDPREIEKAKQGQKQDYPNGIPECGTDALRFALCAMTQGRDLNLDILRVQGYRFFCNKLWNATKFAFMYFPKDTVYKVHESGPLPSTLSMVDKWMMSRLSNAVNKTNEGFQNYDFPAATTACYNLWLYDLCDVYLEYLKPVFAQGSESEQEAARRTLYTVLEYGLKLLSPFMPFVTEELYQRLPRADASCPSICVAAYPIASDTPWQSKNLESDVENVMKIVHAIRSTRSEYNIPNKTKTDVYLILSEELKVLKDVFEKMQCLANSRFVDEAPPAGCSILPISDKIEVHLYLKGLVDAEKEIVKLEKKKEALEQSLKKLKQSMAVDDYETKVPLDVQKTNSEKLTTTEGEMLRLETAIQTLKVF